MLELDSLADDVHSADHEDLQHDRDQVKKSRSKESEYARCYAAHRSSATKPSKRSKRAAFPDANITAVTAIPFTPPQWKVYCDDKNGRWQLFGEGRS
eukprot:5166291-Amphidinium_carterae.1